MAEPDFSSLRTQLNDAISSVRAGGGEPAPVSPAPSPEPAPAAPVAPTPTPAPAAPAPVEAPPPAPAPFTPTQPSAAPPPAAVPLAPAAAPAAPVAPAPVAAPAAAPSTTPTVEDLQKQIADLQKRVAPEPSATPGEGEIYLPVRQDGSLNEPELERMVKVFTADDPQCRDIQAKFQGDDVKLSEISGRLRELIGDPEQGTTGEIHLLEAFLSPDRVKKLGVSVELDEMQKVEAERKLNSLLAEQYRLELRGRALYERQMGRIDSFNARQKQFSDYVTSQVDQRRENVAIEGEVESVAQTFERDTYTTIDSLIAAQPALAASKDIIRAGVIDQIKIEEYTHDGAALEADLRGFISAAIEREKTKLDTYHRSQSAIYGGNKLADAGVPTPGVPPVPPAAPVTTPGGRNPNWESQLKGNFRSLRQNVVGATRGR